MLSLVKRIWLLFLIFTFSLVLLQARNRFLERASSQVSAAVPAFPGAEGFGSQTIGGRGGKVIEVTNLNDSGTGSLRACIDAIGPRNCVFRVGGTITLNSNLNINNPYLTIAGQTAPGGGITLKSANSSSTVHLRVQTHDVIIRYIRSRPGTKVENGRALTVSNSSNTPYNVVIDHVSLSWSGDEMFITWYDTNNITLQWSNISESLPAGDGGYKGPNLGDGGGSGFLSLHHNLLAHHNQRFPLTRTGAGPIDLVNNVMYNLGGYGYVNLRETTKANLVNNYVKAGPNATISTFVRDSEITSGGYYHSGNVVEPGGSVKSFSPDNHRVSTRYSAPSVITSSAQQAFEDVLTKSGAIHGLNCDGTWFNRPDAVDVRIVQSVRDGTRGHNIPPDQTDRKLGFISDPSDVGGWPTLAPGTACQDSDHDGTPNDWENKYGFDSNNGSDGPQDFDNDGHTNLEEFLNATNPKGGNVISLTPTGQTASKTPTPTTAPNAARLKLKIQLPDILASTTNIPASDVQVELRDGTNSVGVAGVDLVRNGNYFQTQSDASFNISQNKTYTVYIKTKTSLRRLFTGVSLAQSQTLDCTVAINPSCGELISQRDNKPLASGDGDGFTVSSGSYNKVDSADLQVLATHFNRPATGQSTSADFNFDGIVNISDLEILGKNYGAVGD